MSRTKVFISYSHADERWLTALKTHLKHLERDELIAVWDDTLIRAGSDWQRELENALDTTSVAILLVSPSFLASDYINSKELVTLLDSSETKGVIILPIIVSACSFKHTPLQKFEAFNSPERPLDTLKKGQHNKIFNEVADRVREVAVGVKTDDSAPRDVKQPEEVKGPTEAGDNFPADIGKDKVPLVSDPTQQRPPIETADSSGKSTDQPKDKVPPRRKYSVPAVVIGLALGLICAAILAYLGFWFSARRSTPATPPVAENENTPAPSATPNSLGGGGRYTVYIVVGGTVHTYLTEAGFFKNVDKDRELDVQVLQGPTGTGAKLFSHVFDDEKEKFTFLVMASKRLRLVELQSNGKPQAVFEAYLGADPLQMLLVAGYPREEEESILNDAFGDILTKSLGGQLDFKNLPRIETWVKGKYKSLEASGIYTGSRDSGTKDIWESHLKDSQGNGNWTEMLKFWDIRDPYQMLLLKPAARIYFGSKVLNEKPAEALKGNEIPHRILAMADGSQKAARGLYLYGFVNNAKDKVVKHGSVDGYYLPKYAARILDHVYKSRLYLLDGDELDGDKVCLKKQMDHFHLASGPESERGWVSLASEDDHVFRARCDKQPKD